MKIYTLKRTQHLPISLSEAWNFFSSPKNLGKITPPYLGFKILYQSGGTKTYAGQIIQYKITVLPGIPVSWITEIKQVAEPHYFIDEQLSGPYRLWHHQHWFVATENGTQMTDEVNYSIPLGLFGRLVNRLFVHQRVNAIFDYRFQALDALFSKTNKESNP